MMDSRPDTEMTAEVALMPAFSTHSLTASLTSPGSLMLPSLITSWGRGTWAKAVRPQPSLPSVSSMTLTELDPISSPNVEDFFLIPNRPIVGSQSAG